MAARKTRRPGRRRLGRQTFTSAAAAARTFYDGNDLFFDHVRDPIDGLRAWADGIDVETGRGRSRRLSKSPAGRKIFEARQGEPQVMAALQWVFQQAGGRRWDAVDWGALEGLGVALEPQYEAPDNEPGTPGLYWRPMIGAGKPLAERMSELAPHDALELGAVESAAGLAEAVSELSETYETTKDCLSPQLRATVELRISEWSRWVRDPSQIPDYACEPDPETQGYVCNYPLVLGELRELRGACRQSYDPQWFIDESEAESPGFPPAPGDPRGRGPAPGEGELAGEREPAEALPEVPTELGAAACPEPGLRLLQTGGPAFGAPRDGIAETRSVGGVFYQAEWRLRSGSLYGPYWYAYWRDESGRRRSRYIGRKFFEITVG